LAYRTSPFPRRRRRAASAAAAAAASAAAARPAASGARGAARAAGAAGAGAGGAVVGGGDGAQQGRRRSTAAASAQPAAGSPVAAETHVTSRIDTQVASHLPQAPSRRIASDAAWSGPRGYAPPAPAAAAGAADGAADGAAAAAQIPAVERRRRDGRPSHVASPAQSAECLQRAPASAHGPHPEPAPAPPQSTSVSPKSLTYVRILGRRTVSGNVSEPDIISSRRQNRYK